MRIALIEDHPVTLNLYAEMLKKSRAVWESDELLTFASPVEFFDYCTTRDEMECLAEKMHGIAATMKYNYFDAIISDYNLGSNHINGYSLLFQLQESGFGGLAILLTGDNSDEMLLRMKHTPTIKYVFKGARNQNDNPYVLLSQMLNDARRKSA